MRRRHPTLLALAVPLFALNDAGCSLLLEGQARQCSSDADCVALGLRGTSCDGQVCVPQANAGSAAGGAAGQSSAGGGGAYSQAGSAGLPFAGSSSAGNGGQLGSAGSGGVATGGSSGAAGGGGTSGAAPVLDLIDDLEDGNRSVRLVSTPKRDGLWDTGNDGTASQIPAPGSFAPVMLGASTPHPADDYAAYTKGSGFSGFGAFLKVDMRNWPVYEQTPQYDARPYSGISFWAKVATGSAKLVRVRFVSGDSDPRGGKCQPPSLNPPHDRLCFNHYFADVTLSDSWQLHSVSFDDFSQGVDGMLSPQIDLAEMYGLEFLFAGGTSFELWLDDLSFIRK